MPMSADAIPALSVLPDYKDVGSGTGTGSFIVDNIGQGSMNWIAATFDTWLHITGGTGVNHGTVSFTYDTNHGNPRTDIITISADGALNSPVSVKVVQSMMGDIDSNNAVDLADAILALKISAGITDVYAVIADVNGDSRIGLPEAVYINAACGRSQAIIRSGKTDNFTHDSVFPF